MQFYKRDDIYRLDASGVAPPPGSSPLIPMQNTSQIPATPYSTVPGRHFAGKLPGRLPGTAAPADAKMMVTPEFSGCTYAFQMSGDKKQLVAGHFNPSAGPPDASGRPTRLERTNPMNVQGDQMASEIRHAGLGFQNPPPGAGNFNVYGRQGAQNAKGYGDGNVDIVAVKNQQNQWEVYAQQAKLGGGFGVTRLDTQSW